MPVIPLLLGLGVFTLYVLLRNDKVSAADNLGKFGSPNASGTGGNFSPKELQVQKFSAIATIAGAAATGVLSALGVAIATAGPVGAVVAAAIIAIGIMRGTAHLVANEWVQKVQNPFHAALAAIVDEKDRSVMNGTASKRSLGYAKEAVQKLWNQYREVADKWRLNGGDYQIVIDQSYETLDYRMATVNGQQQKKGTLLITRILAKLDQQILAAAD